MKTRLTSLVLASLLFIPAIAGAAPTPSTYDDPVWSDYLEKGKTAKVPEGIPTGPGAVSGCYGSGFWPDGYIQIIDPVNMSQHDGILMAESAKVNGRVYASETMKLFLDAVVTNVRKLSKNSDLQVPVQELFFAPGSVPMRILADETTSVEFGAYILNGTITEPVTDVRLHGEVVSKGAAFLLTARTRTAQRYQNYQKIAASFKGRFSMMSFTEFYATTQEILKIANEQLEDLDKGSSENKAAQVEQENSDTEKLNKEKEDKRAQIIEKYEKELDALRDKLILDISKKERDEIVDKIRFIEKQKQSDLQALVANSKLGNDSINIQERLEEIRNGKRLTAAQRKSRNNSSAVRHPGDLVLDEAAMWILVESILTQKAVGVTEIRLPNEMKARLIAYAKKAKKNSKTIALFDEITVASPVSFEVSLSCSVRDRFLGCQLGGNPDIEKRITKAATALLKAALKLPKERQMEIIQLVVNANPVELEYSFDTSTLRREYDGYFDYNERVRYMRLLTALENISIKGESNATRMRRLNKARGVEKESDFDSYFSDYLHELTIP